MIDVSQQYDAYVDEHERQRYEAFLVDVIFPLIEAAFGRPWALWWLLETLGDEGSEVVI